MLSDTGLDAVAARRRLCCHHGCLTFDLASSEKVSVAAAPKNTTKAGLISPPWQHMTVQWACPDETCCCCSSVVCSVYVW